MKPSLENKEKIMTPAKRKMLNISALVVIVASLMGGVVIAGKAIMHARGGMGQIQGNTDQIKGNAARLGVHEEKIHSIEAIVIETHVIVSRIDERMDREHP